jgi:ferredoxin
MKAKVNKSLCISCGTCVSMCPECFKFADDGKSEFTEGCDSGSCDLSTVAEACPTAAIEVIEE